MPDISVFSSAAEMTKALEAGEISAVELLDMHISHIERYNGLVNAIVIRNDEEARRCAQEADTARRKGDRRPLLGLPMTVKDWIELKGVRSTAGDAGFAQSGYIAQTDALVVARLKAAGAVPFAKTNMAPWGGAWFTDNPVFGRTNNPWNLEYTPGGSTGGGGAAVACGFTPLEIGNDIGGSVRIPPAFCGVYGHKPSETTWPRTGQTPDGSGLHLPNPASGLAVMGPLARSAEDLALALDLATGPDKGEDTAWRLELPRARHQRLADFRVAVLPPISWLPVAHSILEKQAELVDILCRAGAKVEEAQPEGFGDLKGFHDIYHRLMISLMTGGMPRAQRLEIAAWAHEEAKKRDSWLLESGAVAFAGMAPEYINWWYEREKYREAYRQFFKQWDVLLSPVAFTNAFRHDALPVGELDPDEHTFTIDGQPVLHGYLAIYPSLATLCGQPATAFPVGLDPDGLPVGLQAIGPYLEDHTPLKFAALVAEQFGGYQQPPAFS